MQNFDGVIAHTGAVNPYWYPPIESRWFDHIEDATLAAGQMNVTLVQFELPLASIGTIRWFGQRVCNGASFDNLIWNIKINEGPDIVYGNIIGDISSFNDPLDMIIKLPRAASVKLVVSNTGVAPKTVIGRLKGWHWVEQNGR